jgi:hypothetical protein
LCGPRPATEKVLEAITAAREALAVEDRLGEDERQTLRAAGVFERFAVDASSASMTPPSCSLITPASTSSSWPAASAGAGSSARSRGGTS